MGKFSRLGNDLYEGNVSIDFMGRKWIWYAISAVILAASLSGLLVKGLNLGIEFKGGVEYTVSMPAADATQDRADLIQKAVSGLGIDEAKAPVVNTAPKAIRITTEAMSTDDAEKVEATIASAAGVPASAISASDVGASLGKEVANRALTGLIVFLILVVLFIWGYFREWKMSVSALVALAHDLLITVGVYALSGFEVTPATVTGILTILGFSLYDTVVVFDKVRENTKDLRKSRKTYTDLANLAVNQTLVRSINTSIVALLPVGALLYVGVFVLGSGPLKDLALALFVGMAAGAYSSIFIATPLLVQLKAGEKEITQQDARARSRAKRDADRYANVPVFTDDMPVLADPEDDDVADGETTQRRVPFQAPTSSPGASGSGRVVPEAKAPIAPSGAANRPQPKREPRSKRGK